MSGGMITIDSSGFADAVMSVNGDLVDFESSARTRLPIGSEDQVLTVSAGLLPNWETLAAGGVSLSNQTISFTNSQTTTSGSLTDISGSDGTVANRTNGKCLLVQTCSLEANAAAIGLAAGLYYDGALKMTSTGNTRASGASISITVSGVTDTDGGAVKAQWRTSTGTATLLNDLGNNWSQCTYFEVS